PEELQEIYTPSPEEIEIYDKTIKGRKTKAEYLILLKTFQRLGRFPLLTEVPSAIVTYISQRMNQMVDASDLARYDRGNAKKRHMNFILDYCRISPYGWPAKMVMKRAAINAARTKEDLADIINIMIEQMVRNAYELPAFSTFLRIAGTSRTIVNRNIYENIGKALSPAYRDQIASLFIVPQNHYKSPWDEIKQEPGRPSRTHFKELFLHLDQISTFPDGRNILKNIPQCKINQFALEAKSLDSSRMTELGINKRVAMAVCLIETQRAKCLDDLGDMYIKRMTKMHHNGEEALNQFHLEHQALVDDLFVKFYNLLVAYQDVGSDQEKVAAINQIVGPEPEILLDKLRAQMAYAGNNYYSFLWPYYKGYRSLLFELIEKIPLASTSQDMSQIKAVKFLKENRKNRTEWIDNPPLAVVSAIQDKWRKLVIGPFKKEGVKTKFRLNRRYFEMCIFSQLMWELKSGDIAIVGSGQYGDYRNQLISWKEYELSIDEYGKEAGIPVKPKEFVNELRQKLESRAKAIDDSFPKNEAVRIEKGEPILRRERKEVPLQKLRTLRRLIVDRLEQVSILDILIDTDRWLGWTKIFGPISGFDAKIKDPALRHVVNAFCYGCNLGPTQTSRSIKEYDRKQIAWINQRHVTEATLEKAITLVINAYNQFSLPKQWGSGKHASADGTKWDLYEQNLLSEYHIRYGGYGGIGYYHVSDTYIALFSHFIPCGVWEAVYILDGLLKNESDIRPDTLHADTQGQSTPVFGLSHLLGIELMPRIRNWKDLKLYRASKGDRYEHIDVLFSNDVIDWKLIETHLPDMLRVAVSIRKGRIMASTILRRIGTYSRKNKVYLAFRELGRAIRTIFLLQFLSSQPLRNLIQSATNKSEALNGFLKWVFFGGQGTIMENDREDQRKAIKYNHLVANLIIFHTVFLLTQVLNLIKKQGHEIEKETLSFISPFITEHINRFGNYSLNLRRKTPPLKTADSLNL
ncbi:MAG: Tn3 family transposase, partial [Nitrospiria bacterium]